MLNRMLVVGLAGVALLVAACTGAPLTTGTPAARAFVATGDAAAKAGKHADAAAAYRQAIETDPNFLDAHQKYIESTRRIVAPTSRVPVTTELLQQYERWAGEHPRQAVYRWALGFIAADPTTADRHLNEAIRIDPRFGRAHVLLAKNADLRGDWTAQREHLKAAVESEPENPQFLLQYANALERSEPQRSRELRASVTQKFPGTPEAGRALYDLATDASGAERRAYFDRLKAEYPSDKFTSGFSGMYTLYGELTSTADALALARDQAKVLPTNKTWATRVLQQEAMARAEALIAERKFTEALAAITATSQPSGRHGTTWALLKAEATAGAGHADQAYTTVAEMLARAPDDRLQAAIEGYGKTLKKTPQEIDADLWRARDARATPAAPFELPSSKDGTPVRLADYRGKVVLVAFWFPG